MISDLLIKWYEINKRDLPWRNTRSPYRIWLSEVILQQTRINQGLGYYNRFIERFPTLEDLADASIDEVLKLWQGLGYYTRARNLHSTAITIVRDQGGSFPATYKELSRLKGVGPYTAAAVASFAFREPVPLTDGNVYRLISRLYDIDIPVNSSSGKKLFLKYARELLNTSEPDTHNQAVMEFGALVCLPRNPGCDSCVLAQHCLALKNGTVNVRPVKVYKAKSRIRFLNYLYLTDSRNTWLRKRSDKDIWHSLYELPLIETSGKADFNELTQMMPWKEFFPGNSIFRLTHTRNYTHKLSHQQLDCTFYRVEATEVSDVGDFTRVPLPDLYNFAVPRVIERFWKELSNS